MKSCVYISIFPVVYEVTSDALLVVGEDCAGFCSTEQPAFLENQIRVFVKIKAVDVSIRIDGDIVYAMSNCMVMTHRNLECRILMGEVNAYYRETDENHIVVEICQADKKSIYINTALLEAFALERFLLRGNALVLHSSFVEWRGQGIVFTAPSGTGKSTQAALWHQHEEAEIINGDRSVIMEDREGCFWVGGLPFCGSSHICRNKVMPLKAVVFIGQSPENFVEKMAKPQAVSRLLGEMSINRWNKEAVMQSYNLINSLACSVPMVCLKCNMEQSAVVALKNFLETGLKS